MIEIQYKRILIIQGILLSILASMSYFMLLPAIDLNQFPYVKNGLILFWIIFIIVNLLFIRYYALPSKSFMQKHFSMEDEAVSWKLVEETFNQKESSLQKAKTDIELENSKFKLVLDSLYDPVCIITSKHLVVYSNLSFNTLFNTSSEVSSHPLIEITRNHIFQDFIKKSILANAPQRLDSLTFSPPLENYKKYYKVYITPIKGTDHFLCVLHDISERKNADQMREDFVANFSHEVKTPLTIINAQLYSLKDKINNEYPDEGLNSTFNEAFLKIEKNSKRMTNLFNDLLVLTRVENKQQITKEEIDIIPIVESLIEELPLNYPGKNFQFKTNLSEHIIYADYKLIEQVFINLIDNALKYADTNNGLIEINSYRQNDLSIIEIKDNGPGIPADRVHRIFERFFRVDDSRSNTIEGTGLGLAIVKHIISKHDGKIKATSHFGDGTQFFLSFPILK